VLDSAFISGEMAPGERGSPARPVRRESLFTSSNELIRRDFRITFRLAGDVGKDFEQGTLARVAVADQAHHFSLLHRDIF